MLGVGLQDHLPYEASRKLDHQILVLSLYSILEANIMHAWADK